MDYNGGTMEEQKTLLQQIRDKEQDYAKKIELVKQETESDIAAVRADREKALLDAEITGKKAAEELYHRETQKTEAEIERIKNSAANETEYARTKGENNLPLAVEKIVGYVLTD